MTKLKKMKLRTQLILIIAITGALCFLLYNFLWMHKWYVWDFLQNNRLVSKNITPYLDDDFWDKLYDEAAKYNFPESEDDTEAIKALQPFFDVADDYTAISIYGLLEGDYRDGIMPKFLESKSFRTYFDQLYRFTDGSIERTYDIVINFKNGPANVMVTFYHHYIFVAPYFFFCLGISIAPFFAAILVFINKKMKAVILLQQRVLQMASGDLTSPVPAFGMDEIGILSEELDLLRLTLHDTITSEQESRKANQDLVAALSHDLRTPLTVLKGYLEIIKRNQKPDMQEQYLERCLKKTDDIREMTDRIFEYALVYEEIETPELAPLSTGLLFRHLTENSDFLRLTGFSTELNLTDNQTAVFLSDSAMLKRIFNNLFSNIIKYGDKKEPVLITGSIEKDIIIITLRNAVKPESTHIESTRIGLKSVQKMMGLMDGALAVTSDDTRFCVTLHFPIYTS